MFYIIGIFSRDQLFDLIQILYYTRSTVYTQNYSFSICIPNRINVRCAAKAFLK